MILFQQLLRIPIVNDMEFEKDENFEIELFEPQGGAKLGKVARTAVTITNDDGKAFLPNCNYNPGILIPNQKYLFIFSLILQNSILF